VSGDPELGKEDPTLEKEDASEREDGTEAQRGEGEG